MGILGRDRTFIIQQPDLELKIPTDLAGLTTGRLDWPRDDQNYRAAVSSACEEIRERIQSLGKLHKADSNLFVGLDPTLIEENDGTISTVIHDCHVTVVEGRIEKYSIASGMAVILPCNEYFDDEWLTIVGALSVPM